MKHFGAELSRFIEANRLKKMDVAERVGITPTYLSQILGKESIDCSLMERLCQAVGMNPASIFEETKISVDVKASTILGNASVNITPGEIGILKELLNEKDKRIELLVQCNEMLSKKIADFELGQNSDKK